MTTHLIQQQLPVLYLHVFVFDLLTGGDAVGDVQVDELRRQVYSRGQPADINRTDVMVCSMADQKKTELCFLVGAEVAEVEEHYVKRHHETKHRDTLRKG